MTMDIQNINSEKINWINWITNLQDHSTIDKLRVLYSSTAIPQWQQDEVLKRVENAKKEDYISWDEVKTKLKR